MRCLHVVALLAAAACAAEREPRDAGVPPPGFVSPGEASLGDEIGSAVLEDGGEVFIGVPGDDGPPDPEGNDPLDLGGAGAVLIVDAATFEPIAVLRAAVPQRGARFGAALAVSANLLAVGAPGDFDPDPDAPLRDATGAVHIFRREGASWVPLGEPLVPEGLGPGDRFGASVSLAGDRLIAGAPGDDRRGDSTGGLYVFVRDGDRFVPAF